MLLAEQLEEGWHRKDDRTVGEVFERFLDDHFLCRKEGEVAAHVRILNEGEDGAPNADCVHYGTPEQQEVSR